MSRQFPTHFVLVKKEGTEHYNLIRKEALTENDVWEKQIPSESWPEGVIDSYIRKTEGFDKYEEIIEATIDAAIDLSKTET